MTLPPFASVGHSPRAGGARDLVAEFTGDDGGTIVVCIERHEDGQLQFCLSRSGVYETCFSRAELGRVINVSLCLFAALRSGSRLVSSPD